MRLAAMFGGASMAATVLSAGCTSGGPRATQLVPGHYAWLRTSNDTGSCYSSAPWLLSTAAGTTFVVSRTPSLAVRPDPTISPRIFVALTGGQAGSRVVASGTSVVVVTSACSIAVSNLLEATVHRDSRFMNAVSFDAVLTIGVNPAVLNSSGGPSDCTAVVGSNALGMLLPFPELLNATNQSCTEIDVGEGVLCSPGGSFDC